MIDPKELRIGNYILYNNQAVIVKGITENAVMLDGVLCETNNPKYPYKYKRINADDNKIRPIPLCDEVLQKVAGIIPLKNGRAYRYHNTSTFFIYEDENANGYYIGLNYMDKVFRVTPCRLCSFHQLQNIHFDQYGVEFIFDEKTLLRSVRDAIEDGLFE